MRAVLSGRLLQRGDTLVLRTELVDVADGSQLWGGEHTSKAGSVFELQDYLSREVSDKLRLRLTTEDKERLTKRYTNDTAAYQLYLQGRYHRNKMSPEGFRKSIEYMNQAVAQGSALCDGLRGTGRRPQPDVVLQPPASAGRDAESQGGGDPGACD